MVTVKEIKSFSNYGKVVCITNGVIEVYVTVDIGPRIIRFGFVGGQNMMCENRAAFPIRGDKVFTDFFGEGRHWENLGGHRIWISPEKYPDTYYPDMDPVPYKVTGYGAVFTPNPEVENGLAKTLEVKMDPDDASLQVHMTVKNISEKEDKTFSIWGLTVCAAGGALIIPTNTNDTGLLPNRIVSVWPYTDMHSDRIYWGRRYVTVTQDANDPEDLKLGFDLNGGQIFYVRGEDIFRKAYETNHPNALYPDGGCSFETFTNPNLIEAESLSELKTVKPGEVSELTESWTLMKKPCEVDLKNDDSIDNLLKRI